MMGDDPDMDQLLDAAGAQCWPSHPPEDPTIVAKQPDANEQPRHHQRRAAQIGSVSAPSGQGRGDPVDVSMLGVPGKAAIDRFRCVGMPNGTPPARPRLFVRAKKYDA